MMKVGWRLFIDESGAFEEPNENVVVGGILIRESAPSTKSTEIQKALHSGLKGFPWEFYWPLHAAHLNSPVCLLLAAHVGEELAQLAASLRWPKADAEEAIQFLKNTAPQEFEVAIEAFRRREWPKDFKSLNKALWFRYAALADDLVDAVRKVWAPIKWVFDSIQPMLVISGEVQCGDDVAEHECGDAVAEDDQLHCRGSHRWLTLLECVLERVADLLCRDLETEPTRLHISVDRRTVCPGGFPEQLKRAHIVNVARRVFPASIVVEPDDIDPCDFRSPDVHGGLVLADFVVNRACPILADRKMSLKRVEDLLRQSIGGVVVRSGNPTASHLSASGSARGLLTRARKRLLITSSLPTRAAEGWPLEQALEWVRVFVP